MKKILLILLSFLYINLSAQTIVDTLPQNKNAILEEFTGIHCTFCPDGHVRAQQIKDAYPNDVFLINLHTGGYANPSIGEPDFRIQESNNIANISNLGGYPAGTVNRHQFSMSQSGGTAMSRSDWGSACAYIIAQPSYLNVGLQAVHDTVTNELIIDVEVFYTDSTPVDGFGFSPINYLNVVLVQDSVLGPQVGAQQWNPNAIVAGPWSPTYVHQHMLRAMPTGQWGEDLLSGPTPVGPGHFRHGTYTYEIPSDINDVIFKIEHIEVIAFVTEGQQGEIIKGNSCHVTYLTNTPSGLVEILPNGMHQDVIYDVYGRIVTKIKKNTIYIKNNKKFIKF